MRADEALRIGLVDELVAHDELHDRALALAAELARNAVVAHGLAKRAIDEGLRERAGLRDRAGAGAVRPGVRHRGRARIGVASFLEHPDRQGQPRPLTTRILPRDSVPERQIPRREISEEAAQAQAARPISAGGPGQGGRGPAR